MADTSVEYSKRVTQLPSLPTTKTMTRMRTMTTPIPDDDDDDDGYDDSPGNVHTGRRWHPYDHPRHIKYSKCLLYVWSQPYMCMKWIGDPNHILTVWLVHRCDTQLWGVVHLWVWSVFNIINSRLTLNPTTYATQTTLSCDILLISEISKVLANGAGNEGQVRRSWRQQFRSKVVNFSNLWALWLDYSKVHMTLNWQESARCVGKTGRGVRQCLLCFSIYPIKVV